jgi:thiosulfate/3-mercaptopyruvate sulfurtransferase
MKRILATAALLLWGIAAQAAGQIVDAAYVAEAIKRGAIIWDARDSGSYAKGHIPGAVNVNQASMVLRNMNTEDFIPTPEIEKILGDAGIDPSKEVIVYGSRGNSHVYFALYALNYFGAPKAFIFHDGIEGWRAGGMPVETQPAKRPPVKLSLTPRPGVAVSTREMVERLRKADVQIVDVRTPGEFTGDDIRALRGGHIPGAINIPYEQNWVDPDTPYKLSKKLVSDNSGMSLKSDADLKKLYEKLDPEKETVVYCQSGVRAAETATVLSKLGFRNVKVYDSSWLAYGNQVDLPAENVQFFNVGVLNMKMSAMQSRIEGLERELAEARGRK